MSGTIPNMRSINAVPVRGKRQRFVQNQVSIQPIFQGSNLDSGVINPQPSIMPLRPGTSSLAAKDAVWVTTQPK